MKLIVFLGYRVMARLAEQAETAMLAARKAQKRWGSFTRIGR
jgi:hypothetical protein